MPRSPMRNFGFELEFSSARVQSSMNDLNCRLNAFTTRRGHSTTGSERAGNWTLKTDHCGFEFTSPAMKATRQNFTKACAVVNKLKDICREHRSNNLLAHQTACTPECGFHVHLEINDLTGPQMRNLVNIFRTFEDAFLFLHAPSRRDNSYVYLLQHQDSFDFLGNNPRCSIPEEMNEHYLALNFGQYNNRHTIEIRYASSTLVGRKVVNWIQILTCLVEFAKQLDNVPYQRGQGVEDLKRFITAHETETWLDSRRATLARWIDLRVEQLAAYQAAREERRARRRQEREANAA